MTNYNVTVSGQEDHDVTGKTSLCLTWDQNNGGGVAQTYTGNATINVVNYEDIDWGSGSSSGDCSSGGIDSLIAGLHQAKLPGSTIYATITVASIPKDQWIGFILLDDITTRTINSSDVSGLAYVVGPKVNGLVNLGPNYTDGYVPSTLFVFKISTDGNTFSIANLVSVAAYPRSSLLSIF